MSPEEWKRLSAALDEVLDLTEGGRDRFLQRLRAESPAFCNEIESLLEQQRLTERLEAPPPQPGEAPTPTLPAAPPRATAGPAASKFPEVAGYEVFGLLGRGGMGVVYQARQRALDRVVALKMIRPGAEADEQDLLRFRTEAEASARLQHPNIVQIYEVGEQDGRPYLALEYVGGGGLDGFLDGAPQPPRAAAEFVAQLARAMHYAHSRGVLHRDLKPSNILLSGEGGETGADGDTPPASAAPPTALAAPKITDFGLAKRLHADSGLTQTGAVLGTPSYMAPEQAAGDKNVGPAADVYALGAILYEMLTGRPPFRGPTAYDTLLQVQQDEPVPPSRLQPRTPRDLETICLKCLQKAPAKRYASAEALADDLGRYLAGRPILARPAGRIERAWRWCRRNPKDAALIAAGVLAVVLGAIAYLWVAGADQDRRERQATATAEAERNLAEAELLLKQGTDAGADDRLLEQARTYALQAREVIDTNAVDEPTRRRVERTLTAIAAAKQEAENKAAAAAEDKRMEDELEKLALSQSQMTTGHEQIINRPELLDKEYERVFRGYHDIDLNQPEEAEARIRASAIKPRLIAALDAWIPLRKEVRARRQLAELANRLSEPDEFRRELRDALVEQDHDRLRRLVKQAPSDIAPRVINDVAVALCNGQDFAEAAALLRPAQQRHPEDFGIDFQLGFCLQVMSPPRYDESVRFYTAAVALQPENSIIHNSLGNALWQQGRLDEAAAEYRTAIKRDGANANARGSLANVLFRQGKLDEAVAEYHAVLQMDGASIATKSGAHNNIGWALGLQGRLDEAVAEYRTAIQLDPKDSTALHNLGWAFLQQGEFQEALDAFNEAKKPSPRAADPRPATWEEDARRAERLRRVGDQLDAIVGRRKQTADAEEGVEYAEVCLYKQYPAAAAQWFQDAFTAAPGLAEKNRFHAAQAAARAGVGRGEDAASVTDEQRAGWRTQARDWLRADLGAWTKKAESDKAEDRQAAARQLRVWQAHVDFTGLRDEADLKKLPQNEQALWRPFWTDVAATVDRAEKR